MPAVTVDDLLTLPRVTAPDATASDRPVRSVTTAPRGFEGEGFPVRRAFHGVDLADLDPFIHLDQMGEVEYAPGEPKGTPWHPHRGFETVTYMIDGILRHQDSHGGGGLITDGDTQWMTAGSGLLHIEAPPEEVVVAGGPVPRVPAVGEPAGPEVERAPLPGPARRRRDPADLADGGTLLRLIAGSLEGHEGPGSTYTPITLIHATLEPGAQVRLPWRTDFNALAYVLAGRGQVGAEHRPIEMGQLALFGGGDTVTLTARDTQESRAPRWTCSCSAGARSASRSPGTGRS
jgi:quercetin 2,3-dioxygenase